MRLQCPHCSQSIAIDDTEAGKSVNCPLCGQSFPAPEFYKVSEVEPLPKPPSPPPIIPPPVAPIELPPDPRTPQTAFTASVPKVEGSARVLSVSLHPATMQWLAPIGLTLAFFLTFFKWTGSFPAGYSAYTQNGWQALFGTMSTDPVSDKLIGMEAVLKDHLPYCWWLLPYFFLLIPAVALAWAHHFVNRGRLRLPALLQKIWTIRLALLAAMAGMLLLLLLIQDAVGFGLERAASEISSEKFQEENKQARTPEEIQRAQMRIAQDLGHLELSNTTWLHLVILLHFLALLGIAAEAVIQQRGNKPPPRIGVTW